MITVQFLTKKKTTPEFYINWQLDSIILHDKTIPDVGAKFQEQIVTNFDTYRYGIYVRHEMAPRVCRRQVTVHRSFTIAH